MSLRKQSKSMKNVLKIWKMQVEFKETIGMRGQYVEAQSRKEVAFKNSLKSTP